MLSRRTLRWTCSGASSTSRKYSLRSMPAENESPAPVSTSTAASSSASTASRTSIISALRPRAHRVALLGPVQRHPRDALLDLHVDGLPASVVAHRLQYARCP